MDEQKRATLELIERAIRDMLSSGKISVADAGKQLVGVSLDFIVVGDLDEARRVLLSCHVDYFAEHLQKQRDDDRHFDDVARQVDDVFCLRYMRKPAGNA